MKRIAIAALLSAFIATPALAEGIYGALDLGQSTAQDACNTTGVPAGVVVTGCKDASTLYRIAGGYEFSPVWGAEVSYGAYGKASLGTATIPGLGTVALGDLQLNGMQVSGIGNFPLGDAFTLIGKIGLARTDIKLTVVGVSATSTNLAYGVGAQYGITKNVAVRAQYEDLGTVGDANSTGTAKVALLSAGVVLKF